jgi:hypothetical protein
VIEFKTQFPTSLVSIQKSLLSAALAIQPELLDETSLQRQLVVAALKLPANLTDTERAKVSSVVKLTVQRDAVAPPE